MTEHYLQIPLEDHDVTKIKLGDAVYFSGRAFTCRSKLQRYIFDEGHTLPFDTECRNVLIHVGPIVVKKKNRWELIAFTPTSSIRFEKWGPAAVRDWNLKAVIGKTTMGKSTGLAMKEMKCIHATPQYIGPNLLQNSIQIEDVHLFEELGSIEAAWQLKLDKLGPFLVDIDCEGNNYFDKLDKRIASNVADAYAELNIPADFEYTKLY